MSLESDPTWSDEDVEALIQRPIFETAPSCKIDHWLKTNSLWIKPSSDIPSYAQILRAIKQNQDSETTTLLFSDPEGNLFSVEGRFEIMYDHIPAASDLIDEEGTSSDVDLSRKISSDFEMPVYSTSFAPYDPF